MTTSPLPPAAAPSERDPVRLRASRPADLLALVPFLIGFHPTESLVALLLRDGQVLLAVRCDLPPAAAVGATVERDRLVATVADLVEQHRPSGLLLVAYSADAGRGRAVLDAWVGPGAGPPEGTDLVDVLLVDGRRWWSLVCEDGCCPEEGLPYAPQEHPLSAEAVWAGLVAAPSRGDVVSRVSGPPESEWRGLREVARQLAAASAGGRLRLVRRSERRDAVAAAVVDALPRVGSDPHSDHRSARLDDAACIALALLVVDVITRDMACAMITREDALRHVALWQEVVARTPPELASAPLCLLGIAAWAQGNGTLLNACCDRLGELDPRYPMARLLSDVSDRALPPVWWDAMADGLRRELGVSAVGR